MPSTRTSARDDRARQRTGLTNFAETLLRAGDNEQAKKAAERAGHRAYASKRTRPLGPRTAQAVRSVREDLNDYEKMVQVYELSPPTGYADMESFNRDLNAFLDSVHRDNREPLDRRCGPGRKARTICSGTATTSSSSCVHRSIKPCSPISARWPKTTATPCLDGGLRYQYSASWSSRLHDCGFHTDPSSHGLGQLLLFCSTARCFADDAASRAAQIRRAGFRCRFRQSDPPHHPAADRTAGFVPVVHVARDNSFRSDDARTTVAFDVVPR